MKLTEKTPGVLGGLGIVDRAPSEVSEVLLRLNMSHTMAWRDGFRNCATHVYGTAKEQPIWPVVVDSLKTLTKMTLSGRYLYLVVDSRAEVSNTNLSNWMWPEKRTHETFTENLTSVLIASHKSAGCSWVLKVDEPSLMDYVNTAVKPSQLTEFQTLTCKINPYSLRKEVQDLCIMYMVGSAKDKALKAKLGSNFRLQPLLDLMRHPRTQELRSATLRTLAGELIGPVCKEMAFETFEVMYFIKAAELRNKAKG